MPFRVLISVRLPVRALGCGLPALGLVPSISVLGFGLLVAGLVPSFFVQDVADNVPRPVVLEVSGFLLHVVREVSEFHQHVSWLVLRRILPCGAPIFSTLVLP